jgi:hypothetical protein
MYFFAKNQAVWSPFNNTVIYVDHTVLEIVVATRNSAISSAYSVISK